MLDASLTPLATPPAAASTGVPAVDPSSFDTEGEPIVVEEIVIIERYLPEKLGEDEILAAIASAKAETGAAGPADIGKLMGVLKPKLAGQADMGLVSVLVKKALAGCPPVAEGVIAEK